MVQGPSPLGNFGEKNVMQILVQIDDPRSTLHAIMVESACDLKFDSCYYLALLPVLPGLDLVQCNKTN